MLVKRKWARLLNKENIILAVCTILIVLIVFKTVNSITFIRCPCEYKDKTKIRVANSLTLLLVSDDNKTVIDQLEEDHQPFPAKFLYSQELSGNRCHTNPGIFSIRHQNIIWQEAQIFSTKFLLYSAHLDNRNIQEGSLIRILALADTGWPSTPYCLVFTDKHNSPIASKAISLEYIHWQYPLANEWQPFIITCRGIDEDGNPGKVVSLADTPCSSQPTNALRVLEKKTKKKKNLTLCTKFLYDKSNDFSIRLIEWIETVLQLGVESVTFYVHSVHPNVVKVLNYYEEIGIATQFLWRNPAPFPNSPFLQKIFYDSQRYALFTLENIPYTDCLLRHLNSHKFVGTWDIDEMFIPKSGASIMPVITEARNNLQLRGKQPATSYSARVAYFFTNFTDYSAVDNYTEDNRKSWTDKLEILTHSKRSLKFTPLLLYTKSIHDTSLALGIHAHYALSNIHGKLTQDDIYNLYPESEAFIGHYRNECQTSENECNSDYRSYLVEDKTILRQGDKIFHNTNEVVNKLNIL